MLKLQSNIRFLLVLGVILFGTLTACGGGGGGNATDDATAPQADTASPQADTAIPPNCTPSCLGKQCGDDGCGALCPNLCTDSQTCENGTCKTAGCTAQCSGKQCGDDGCGGSCGTCSGDTTCSATGQCTATTNPNPVTGNCPANGTGYGMGDQIKNITWTESTGETLELHSFCGVASAIVIIESAGW